MSVQLSLDFEPGLTAKYRALEDAIAATVYRYGGHIGGVAAKLDQSPSELSRRLTAHLDAKAGDVSNRPLRVCDLYDILVTTGDYTPIGWLIERFLGDPETKRTHAIHALAQMLPTIQSLVEEAGGKSRKR